MKKIFFLLIFCISAILLRAQIGPVNPISRDIFIGQPGGPTIGTDISTTSNPVTAARWHFGGWNQEYFSEDWIYSIVVTDKKETIAVGYQGRTGEHPPVTVRAVILKLDHNGRLVWVKEITSATVLDFSSGTLVTSSESGYIGSLWAVTKASDGYVAVGRGSVGMLMVEFDDNGNFLNGTPLDVKPYRTPTTGGALSGSYTVQCHAFSVAVDPNTNSVNNIIVGARVGVRNVNSWDVNNKAALLRFNYSSGTWSLPYSFYEGEGGSTINKILTRSTGSSTYDIYACGSISAGSGATADHRTVVDDNLDYSGLTFKLFNKDVWIFKIDNTLSSGSYKYDYYNKDNIKVNVTGGPPAAVNSSYTNSEIYKYQEFGPLTARNMNGSGYIPWYYSYYLGSTHYGDNAYHASPATYWLNANNNYAETAGDMIFTNDGSGKIALIAGVNFIGGMTNNLYNDAVSFVRDPAYAASVCPQYKEYMDCDAFLLSIDPDDIGTTTSTTIAKNVGHFSGLNFNMQVRQDAEHHFIITGGTSDHYGSSDINLPDCDQEHADHDGFIIAATNDFSATEYDLWRRSYSATDAHTSAEVGPDGHDNNETNLCIFGLELTADGGYVIGGNNDNNQDDFSVTKFGPLHQNLMIGGIGGSYEPFGYGFIPAAHVVSGTENWTSSMNVASKVVIPSGATLNITGSGTVISFAASDQLWDYSYASDGGVGTIGCGIIVEPGGKLYITNATLQGISIAGQHNVWDGIVVQGTYSAIQSTTYQGLISLNGATIKDARYGLYVAENYRTYHRDAPVTYSALTTNQHGCTYSSRYDGTYSKGGGMVSATNCTFLNCMYGANFENYFFHFNNSTFNYCNFNSDNAGMGDVCFYTDGEGRLLPANTHISATQWRSLNIYNSTFACDASFIAAHRTAGVVFRSCGMNINGGNTFTNLSYGIHGSAGSWSFPITINNNTFNNNGYGVAATGLPSVLTIKNNQFNIPGFPNPYPSDLSYYHANPTGVELAGCIGYNVSQNTFDKCTGCDPYFGKGIVVNNGHSLDEIVKLNTFERVTYATIAAQLNGNTSTTFPGGLQFLCNGYNRSTIAIDRSSYLLGATSYAATMRPLQGNCGIATSPAGNQFVAACVGSTFRLHVEDWLVSQIVTYNNNYAGSVYDPGTCINGSKYTNIPCSVSGSEPGVSTACPMPCVGCEISDYLEDLETLDGAIAENTDEDAAAALQTQHTLLVNEIARRYAAEEDYAAAAALYAGYNMYRYALPLYMAAGDYTSAGTMHSSLPTGNDEEKLYAWETGLAISLYGSGDTWFDIDSTSLDSLKKIVQYNKASGYMAGGILTLLGVAPVTLPVPIMDDATMDTIYADTTYNSWRNGNNDDVPPITNMNKSGTGSFSVFPNPNYGQLSVKASVAGSFELYTMAGQLIDRYRINAGNSDMQLPANLASGMYMGIFRPEDRGATSTVKLVYQP